MSASGRCRPGIDLDELPGILTGQPVHGSRPTGSATAAGCRADVAVVDKNLMWTAAVTPPARGSGWRHDHLIHPEPTTTR
ncbi:hypothetical protein [Austwickia chelonae]|uniref:hypothetical protein n=1 Tax=Austwickia chelonae TaxID=100225 RepID=UPI00058E5DA7|nr:hypothetical protein [Austwickia chelonae]